MRTHIAGLERVDKSPHNFLLMCHVLHLSRPAENPSPKTHKQKKKPPISKRLPSFLLPFRKETVKTHTQKRFEKSSEDTPLFHPAVFFLHAPVSNCLLFGNGITFKCTKHKAKIHDDESFECFKHVLLLHPLLGRAQKRRHARFASCEIDCACARNAPCFPLPRSHSPRASSPSPAACTQPGGTTNVHYTRRIRLDVFHIQEYVLIMI